MYDYSIRKLKKGNNENEPVVLNNNVIIIQHVTDQQLQQIIDLLTRRDGGIKS